MSQKQSALLRPLSLATLAICLGATTSCIQTTGGLNGLGGGYPPQTQRGNHGYGSPYGQQPRSNYHNNQYGGQYQDHRGHTHSPQQTSQKRSLPPGFTNDVKGLDHATDDVLDATHDYLKENGRIPPTGGYQNLFKAAQALESSCDTLEKHVSRGTSAAHAHQLIDAALEASSYLKLRISRHSDITPRLKNTHAGVHRELESLDQKLGH